MPSQNLSQYDREGLTITDADFVAGKDDATQLSPGTVGEVATAQVGTGGDGQLTTYDLTAIGENPDPQDPTAGRVFMDLRDDADAELPSSVQVRFAYRDRNSNRRQPVTRWFSNRDLDQADPDLRKLIRPVTRGGKIFPAKDGRLIVLEVKNESADVTFSLANSEIEVPGLGFY